MDFFSWNETVKSLFLSIGFGVVFSILCSLISVVGMSSEGILTLFKRVPYYSTHIRELGGLLKSGVRLTAKKHTPAVIVCDFIKTVVFGIAFSIVLYTATDGIFRIYMLALSLGSAILVNRTLGRYVRAAEKKLIEIALTAVVFIISPILFPIAAPLWILLKKYCVPKVKIYLEKTAKYSKKSHNTPIK